MTGERILQVDAQGSRRTTVADTLTGGTRFAVDPEPSGGTAADTLRHEAYDAVVVGHPLPDGTESFVERLRGAYADLPIVAYGEAATLDAATTRDLFRAGVTDLFVLDGDDGDGLDALVADLPERIETFHERRRDRVAESAFREVIGRVSASDTRMAGALDDVLSGMRRVYDVDFAALLRVVDDELQVVAADAHRDVPLAPDDVLPIAETYCKPTVAQNRTVSFGDVSDRTDDGSLVGDAGPLPDLSKTYVADVIGFECYLGTPVEVNGKPYGTLCVAGRSRRNGFANWERTLIDLTAAWLGRELDHEQEKTDLRDAASDA